MQLLDVIDAQSKVVFDLTSLTGQQRARICYKTATPAAGCHAAAYYITNLTSWILILFSTVFYFSSSPWPPTCVPPTGIIRLEALD